MNDQIEKLVAPLQELSTLAVSNIKKLTELQLKSIEQSAPRIRGTRAGRERGIESMGRCGYTELESADGRLLSRGLGYSRAIHRLGPAITGRTISLG